MIKTSATSLLLVLSGILSAQVNYPYFTAVEPSAKMAAMGNGFGGVDAISGKTQK